MSATANPQVTTMSAHRTIGKLDAGQGSLLAAVWYRMAGAGPAWDAGLVV
jgi:hypothetical protein